MEDTLVLSRYVSWIPLGPDRFLCGHAFTGDPYVVDVEQRTALDAFRSPLAIDDYLARHDPNLRDLLRARLQSWRRQGVLVEARIDEDTHLQAALRPRATKRHAWKVVYLGAPRRFDALVEQGAERGCTIEALACPASDLGAIDHARPDLVVVADAHGDALDGLLRQLRQRTSVPILVRNQIGPAYALRGLADRGPASTINQVRANNLGIATVAERFPDVHVVDVDQAVALAGTFGDADLEHVLAGEELRVMLALRGVGRRKVVVVDLDETLWPGLLAETGAPFASHLSVDAVSHYLGLHEALLALRDRGILLACVSKNDEDVVKALWRYPAAFEGVPTLSLSDFATYRINWQDKADNLLAIAAELNLGIDTFAFIDDNAHERERVRARLPDVLILGDNPFAARWQLLTQPAFQVPHVTDESRHRSEMVRGQLERERERVVAPDPDAFVASLDMRCTIRRETDERNVARIVELVHRTTQLNTTGEQPTLDELRACTIYTLAAADRFADYGLVGVCITEGAVIRQLVLSCRVIGLRLEQVLVRAAARDVARRTATARIDARLIPTARNQPARQVFAACGFTSEVDDATRWSVAADALDVSEPTPYAVTCIGCD